MSVEKGKLYAFWLDFFRAAGILPTFDSKYALVFEDNRIKPDMLLDLTKECLRDMEITAMGDIIAILRHAKIANEKSKTLAFGNTGDQGGGEMQLPTVGSANSTSTPSSPTMPKPATSAKVSEKVTTTTPALAATSSASKEPVNVKLVPNKVTITNVNTPNKTAGLAESVKKDAETTNVGNVSSKESDKQTAKVQKRFIIMDPDPESSSDSDIPEKRPRNVNPVQVKRNSVGSEGVSGLLSSRLGPSVANDKPKSTDMKGVFARLGRSSEGNPCISGEATIIRPNISFSLDQSSGDSSSVFERLGGRGTGSAPRTIAAESSSSRSRTQDDPDRHREILRRDQRDSSGRSQVGDRRITLRQRSPEPGSPVDRVSRNPQYRTSPLSRPDERNLPTRMRDEYKTPSPRRYDRPEPEVRSTVASTVERAGQATSRRKIVGCTAIKIRNNGEFRVGQVLKTTRIDKGDGKSVVQRLIVKKIPKQHSRRHFRDRFPPRLESASNFLSTESEPESD